MAKVKAKYNENFTSLLRRFKKSCDEDGIVIETRKRKHFEKPSTVRKLAKSKAIKRAQAKIEEETSARKKNY